MGAWGGVCIFDHACYLQQVIPAFAIGEQHPLIQRALAQAQQAAPQRILPLFRGLSLLTPYCEQDLTDCSLGTSFSFCDGVLVTDSRQLDHCTDHWGYEALAELFETVITIAAIKQHLVLGLSFTALTQLFPHELALDEITQELLVQLDSRCRYWALGTGGYGEGIHGWLDQAETELLALGLAALGSAIHKPHANQAYHAALFDHWSGDHGTVTRHLAKIGQFIALLQQAVMQKQGLLWGRDLRIFYSS